LITASALLLTQAAAADDDEWSNASTTEISRRNTHAFLLKTKGRTVSSLSSIFGAGIFALPYCLVFSLFYWSTPIV
jgi:hypothetical protein